MSNEEEKPEVETLPTDLTASEHEHNRLVRFAVSCIFAWDGNPETDGAEYYAPADFDMDAHCAANGVDKLLDGNGDPVVIAGTSFLVARIHAEAWQKQKLGKIEGE